VGDPLKIAYLGEHQKVYQQKGGQKRNKSLALMISLRKKKLFDLVPTFFMVIHFSFFFTASWQFWHRISLSTQQLTACEIKTQYNTHEVT
jgi:hypothetical protein